MIALDSQQVITALADDGFRNFGLTGHSINCDTENEHLNKYRDSGDFIALAVGFQLSQHQLVGRSIGTDYMNGDLSVVMVIGTP